MAFPVKAGIILVLCVLVYAKKTSQEMSCQNTLVLSYAAAYASNTRWRDWSLAYTMLAGGDNLLNTKSTGVNLLLGLTALTRDDLEYIFKDISKMQTHDNAGDKHPNNMPPNKDGPTSFTKDQLEEYFNHLDKDGDGVFSGSEFLDFWQKMQPRLPDLGCPIGPLDFSSEMNPWH